MSNLTRRGFLAAGTAVGIGSRFIPTEKGLLLPDGRPFGQKIYEFEAVALSAMHATTYAPHEFARDYVEHPVEYQTTVTIEYAVTSEVRQHAHEVHADGRPLKIIIAKDAL